MKVMNVSRVCPNDVILVVIDVQDAFFNHVLMKEKVKINLEFLLDVLPFFEIPVIVTEQYPKGLGSTSDWVLMKLQNTPIIPKITFSALQTKEFHQAIKAYPERKTVILVGIEAHICVYQTALDFLEQGYRVFVLRDAISSRFHDDYLIGIERLKEQGCIITSTEQIVYEFLQKAGTPLFKNLLPYIIKKDQKLKTLKEGS